MSQLLRSVVIKIRRTIVPQRWIPLLPAPAAEPWSFEGLALQLLQDHGAMSLDSLEARMAEEALRVERAGGGWAVDVGILSPNVYRGLAKETLRRMIGSSLVLESEGEGLLAVPWSGD